MLKKMCFSLIPFYFCALLVQWTSIYGAEKDCVPQIHEALGYIPLQNDYEYLEYAYRLTPPITTNNLDSINQWLSDYEVICNRYRSVFGEYPNLKNPVTFSEKIIYKQLFDRRETLTLIADKIKVRDFVRLRIGSEYLQNIYQIAQNPDEINWDPLPSRFVIKTNHGSGWNILVQDKKSLDRKLSISLLRTWLNTNYYDHSREWCYKDIPRCLFVEEMLLNDQGKIPTDWKFFVFSGKAKFIQVNINRFENNQCNIYDRNLQLVNVRYHWDNFADELIFPPNIEEMFNIAERLGEGLDFIRVDLYNVDGRIVFGELTNYPLGGLAPFEPHEFDRELGEHWTLPTRYK